jgi:hypothetical protein
MLLCGTRVARKGGAVVFHRGRLVFFHLQQLFCHGRRHNSRHGQTIVLRPSW